jgi:hypothetical protein
LGVVPELVEVSVVEQVKELGEDLAVVLEEVLEVVQVEVTVIGFKFKYSQSYYVMCYS